MIAKSHRQLELDFSNEQLVAGATSAEHRDSNFEFYQQTSRNIRALLKENRDLKSRLEAVSNPAPQGEGYAVGDRVTLIDAPPGLLYEIVRLSPTTATCRCLASPAAQRTNNRSVALWKIRPACSIGTAPPDASGCETDPKSEVLPGCLHPRMHPGLDRAYCPDCNREFKPWSKEYKSSLECAVVSRPPGQSSTEVRGSVQGDSLPSNSCPGGRLPEVASEDKHTTTASGWIEKYVTRRRWEYYRYCWQEGRKGKVHRTHIPNDSGKLTAVRSAIAQGRSPQQIEQLIKSWRAGKSYV